MIPQFVLDMGGTVFGRYKLDPLALELEENSFLAATTLGGVEVRCLYKQSSQWGVLTGLCRKHDRCPAWQLVMDLEIQQVLGKLDYASLSVDFSSKARGNRPRHGVLVTDYYGPRRARNNLWQFDATTSPSDEEGDPLPRRITWTIKEARGPRESQLTLSWGIWVVVRHDGDDPFLIRPAISGRLQGLDRIWAFWPREPITPRTVEPLRNEEMELNRNVTALSPVSSEENACDKAAPLTTGLESAFVKSDEASLVLFDDDDDSGSDSGQNRHRASQFLDHLDDWREQRYESLQLKPAPPEFLRTKIAILDTGVDRGNPILKGIERRTKTEYSRLDNPIKSVNDFIGTGGGDEDGHGTLTVSLLLRVAPRADIYVAKIATGKTSGQCDNIANAIDKAATEWNADIIVMPFGIKGAWSRVARAINDAYHKDAILIASAANGGGNEGRAYPARDERVICLHATDGNGNDNGGINPSPLKFQDNFATLGLGVKFFWSDRDVYKSGTSYSAPVAAGIASNILDFISNPAFEGTLSPDQRRLARTGEGIKKIFRLMGHRKGYDYIAPWNLWEEGLNESDVYSKLRTVLK